MLAYNAIKTRRARTVLILDDDIGFAFWCGHLLIDGGYFAVTALSVSDAITLIDTFRLQLDVLVFNPLIPGVGEFVNDLHEFQKQLGVIVAIESPSDLAQWSTSTCTTKLKPSVADDNEAAGWLTAVDLLLTESPARR